MKAPIRPVEGPWGPRQRSSKGPFRYSETRLGALVADQVLDQLDLVVLALAAEVLDRLGGGQLAALERLVGLDVLGHPLLDPGEVLLAGPLGVGELDVVVEAVGDRRADRDLRLRPEVEHRLGEHVGGVVAKQLERLGALLGDDLDRLAPVQGRGEVAELAVHLHRQGRLREPGPDRRGGVGAGRPRLQLQLGAVGSFTSSLVAAMG